MLSFGIIAEGPCDQAVIENILLGYFEDEDEEPVINYVQPIPATSGSPPSHGGWTLVFKSLAGGDPQKALQFNDYLVIQIDTDVQEEVGFDVPRREQGIELSAPERVVRVIDRLRGMIDRDFYEANKHRILFAVAVDSIECWLLPLLYNNNKAKKTSGCLKTANIELRRAGRNGLSAGETKFVAAYGSASRDYTKRNKLIEICERNPSLGLFVKQLDSLRERLIAERAATLQVHGNAAPQGGNPPESTANS